MDTKGKGSSITITEVIPLLVGTRENESVRAKIFGWSCQEL